MPDSKRLFLGFALSDANAKTLAQLQSRLGDDSGMGVEVSPSNLHLTLAFLGQANLAQQQALCTALDDLPKPGFCQHLDTLVHWQGARVICLWGKAQDTGLIGMFDEVQRLAGELGLHQSEHKFNPHITLRRKARAFVSASWQPEPIVLTPEALHLYHSQSTEMGVTYRIIKSWPIQGDTPR